MSSWTPYPPDKETYCPHRNMRRVSRYHPDTGARVSGKYCDDCSRWLSYSDGMVACWVKDERERRNR